MENVGGVGVLFTFRARTHVTGKTSCQKGRFNLFADWNDGISRQETEINVLWIK